MKRYIIIVAAVAIAAVSCSRTYDVNPVGEREIGFGTWAEVLTKDVTPTTPDPRTPGTNYFRTGSSFAVYGYKETTTPAAKVSVFDDDVVVATAEGGSPVAATTWDYNNHRFWDANYDSYTFFGISPSAVGTAATVTSTTGAIETASITFAGNDNDILIAEKKTVEKGTGASTTYFNSYGVVNLVFNHVASLVDVKVKKAQALATATVTVSSIALEKIQSAGVLTITEGMYDKTTATSSTAANVVVGSWSSTATDTYTPEEGVTPVYGANGTSAIANDNRKTVADTDTGFNPASHTEPVAATDFFTGLIVKPQTFTAPTAPADPSNASNDNAQRLTITYQITVTDANSQSCTNEYTSTLWLSDFDVTNDGNEVDTKVGAFFPGRRYTLYVTIDAHAIEFSASINDWEMTVSGYHYLVN